jgi:RHS repeat-associated protein
LHSLGHLTYKRDVEQSAPHSATDTLTGNNSWSTKIVYDTQGRVTDTYDARNVRAQYTYDGLNRVTGITYTGETTGTTPRTVYTYDQAQTGYFNKGRLTRIETITGTSTVQTAHDYDYDLMGRVVKQQQSILTSTYNLSYTYDLAGQLVSETYPSNRVVSYKYDEGMRLSEVRDASQIYANGYTYFAHGGLASETWNNGGVYSLSYNNRLQPTQIKLTIGGAEKQRYDYLYGQVAQTTGAVDATKNTGQVARIEGFVNAVRQWQQRFSYDTLGRLDIASEYRGDVLTTKVYESNYDYDRWGNRMQVAASNPSVLLPYWEVKPTDIDPTNNRIKSVTGATMTYDGAGNLTVDGKFRGRKYQYDANNRQRQSTLLNDTDASTAMYDGAGQRVQTIAGGVTRNLVYDINGQVVAEYETGSLKREHIYRGGLLATREAAGSVQYVMADHQGSTRAVTDQTGTVVSRHDYLAFGEEIGSTVGMRTAAQGYGGTDAVSRQYASTERDEATGLDHTLWRKYEQRGGRWTSPDPYNGSMEKADPQSFNRYSYVENDPVNLVDPSGLIDYVPKPSENPPPPPSQEYIDSFFLGLDNGPRPPMGTQNPPGRVFDDSSLGPPPAPACGVNPITNQPGFTRNPTGVPGHLRPGVRGRGFFHAPRSSGTPHQGLDISGRVGDPIHANLAGIVHFAGRAGDAGNLVIIDHGDGLFTRYAHLSEFADNIQSRTEVREGEVIGYVGRTGNAAGQPHSEDHVHFGVQTNGLNSPPVDPETYLNSLCP